MSNSIVLLLKYLTKLSQNVAFFLKDAKKVKCKTLPQ